MESQSIHSPGSRAERWTALVLCGGVLVAGALGHLLRNKPAYAETFAPDWIHLAAAGFAVAGIMPLNGRSQWLRIQEALLWSGLLLMVWAANGLPFDLLRLTPLIPLPVDWPGLATRTLAFATAVVLAHLSLGRSAASASQASAWYGYAAFVLALPYPVLRTLWAFGLTPGLSWSGAAGKGWAPCVLAVLGCWRPRCPCSWSQRGAGFRAACGQ